jgi:hypothetical protein
MGILLNEGNKDLARNINISDVQGVEGNHPFRVSVVDIYLGR